MKDRMDTKTLACAAEIIRRESLLDNGVLSEAAKSSIMEHGSQRLGELVAKNRIRSLKSYVSTMVADLDHSVRTHTKERIFLTVLQETGLDLHDFVKSEAKSVAAILKRAAIGNEGEYRKIRKYLDDLEASTDDHQIVAKINALLGEYEAGS